ncbi:uncharacterized protein LOC128956644 [Oppia nitens]|uniref:uncharacterized protein LOC128956644 n=1 Tax=Oppia nitens TaxID=1686743 RepID=UPI0023DBC1E5|nr:uncharacterized protein LOC128956644 [Oppia nitens]
MTNNNNWLIVIGFQCLLVLCANQSGQWPTRGGAQCGQFPEIDLGTVDLSHNPQCQLSMEPYITRCTNLYRYGVQQAMERYDFNVSAEPVKRATCCGVLRAQHCFARAARSRQPECGIREARAFEKLPIDADAVAIMNRQCDGYYLSSKVCSSSADSYGSSGSSGSIAHTTSRHQPINIKSLLLILFSLLLLLLIL